MSSVFSRTAGDGFDLLKMLCPAVPESIMAPSCTCGSRDAPPFTHALNNAFERIFNVRMNNQTGGSRAIFAHVPEGTVANLLSDTIQVGRVIHYNAGILPPFQHTFSVRLTQ